MELKRASCSWPKIEEHFPKQDFGISVATMLGAVEALATVDAETEETQAVVEWLEGQATAKICQSCMDAARGHRYFLAASACPMGCILLPDDLAVSYWPPQGSNLLVLTEYHQQARIKPFIMRIYTPTGK